MRKVMTDLCNVVTPLPPGEVLTVCLELLGPPFGGPSRERTAGQIVFTTLRPTLTEVVVVVLLSFQPGTVRVSGLNGRDHEVLLVASAGTGLHSLEQYSIRELCVNFFSK